MPAPLPVARALLDAARDLSAELEAMRFGAPVAHVRDPWRSDWAPYEASVRRYGATRKRIAISLISKGMRRPPVP